MRQLLTVGSFLGLLALASCYDPHARDSPIIRELQAAGAGDLSTFTQQGLGDWLGKHPKLATKIAAECLPIAQKAQANWNLTAEGTACQVAARSAPPPEYTADPRAW